MELGTKWNEGWRRFLCVNKRCAYRLSGPMSDYLSRESIGHLRSRLELMHPNKRVQRERARAERNGEDWKSSY